MEAAAAGAVDVSRFEVALAPAGFQFNQKLIKKHGRADAADNHRRLESISHLPGGFGSAPQLTCDHNADTELIDLHCWCNQSNSYQTFRFRIQACDLCSLPIPFRA